MYSQSDINSAVAAGALSAEAASALRDHVAAQKGAITADAEHFRLITGFNDIFVSIGVVIMLFAAGGIGQAVTSGFWGPPPFAGVFVAITAWGLAEFFTRRRRMALPSIILLLAFLGGIALALGGFFAMIFQDGDPGRLVSSVVLAVSGLLTAAAAWAHWKRFMVPITIAGGVAALAATAVGLIMIALAPEISDPQTVQTVMLSLVFAGGLVIFAFAMRWDASDPSRVTRRSDVAFWLHLLAAPMLAHPLFSLIGVTQGDDVGISGALGVLAIYLLFALVALAIDRRAVLVSALAYVLFALTYLFREFGVVELNVALTALVIGSALLTLSAFWSPMRRKVVNSLPEGWTEHLPEPA